MFNLHKLFSSCPIRLSSCSPLGQCTLAFVIGYLIAGLSSPLIPAKERKGLMVEITISFKGGHKFHSFLALIS